MPRARRARPEAEIQERLVGDLLACGYIAGVHFWHTKLDGRVSKPEAARRKAAGVAAGVPDLLFVIPGYPPTALELKAPGGDTSDAQDRWIANATEAGWRCGVAKGYEGARAKLREWGILP